MRFEPRLNVSLVHGVDAERHGDLTGKAFDMRRHAEDDAVDRRTLARMLLLPLPQRPADRDAFDDPRAWFVEPERRGLRGFGPAEMDEVVGMAQLTAAVAVGHIVWPVVALEQFLGQRGLAGLRSAGDSDAGHGASRARSSSMPATRSWIMRSVRSPAARVLRTCISRSRSNSRSP